MSVFERGTNWGRSVAEKNSCFKILSAGSFENKNYVILLNINKNYAKLMKSLHTNVDDVSSLTKDEKTIWCGTTDGELYAFDPSTKKFTLHYTMNITASVYGIHKNKDNSFWLVTSNNQSGLLYISPEGKAENIFSFNDGKSSMRFPSQRCLLALDDDLLLIGSRTHGLYKYDVKKGEITNYNNNLKGKRYIPSDYITSITKDQKGRIWISTFGGGLCLFDINKGVVKTITEEDGLANNEICMVVKDQKGLLWLSSTHCISSFNLRPTRYITTKGILSRLRNLPRTQEYSWTTEPYASVLTTVSSLSILIILLSITLHLQSSSTNCR